MEDLFVNHVPPTGYEEPVSKGVMLEAYLKQDFNRKGYDDGYNYHSSEMLENRLKLLRADFRLTIDLKLDQTRQEILKLENHKVDMEGLSERLVKQLENKVATLLENVKRLESEKGKSSMDEGLVMTCIHNYRDGFMRGSDAYMEEKIIASCTGLFN